MVMIAETTVIIPRINETMSLYSRSKSIRIMWIEMKKIIKIIKNNSNLSKKSLKFLIFSFFPLILIILYNYFDKVKLFNKENKKT